MRGTITTLLLLAVYAALVVGKRPDPLSFYEELLTLGGDVYESDPIFWKAKNAALYADAAQTGETSALGATEDTMVAVGGSLALVATQPSISAILAFSVSPEDVSAQSAGQSMATVPFLTDFLEVQTSSEAINLFSEFLSAGLNVSVMGVSQPETPSSVLCTAHGDAGLLVPLCATWAATTWPNAHITAITFDSPWMGDARYNWTFSQLVDTFYLFPDDLSQFRDGELAEQSLTETLDIIYKGGSDRRDTARAMRLFLDDATHIEVLTASGEDQGQVEEDTSSNNTTDPIDKGVEYDAYQMNLTIDTCTEAMETSCPLVLCKTRLGAYLSAMIYWEYDPENPEWIGPVPLDRLYPDSVRIKGEYDVDVSVYWDEAQEAVYFIWRGSESDEDWVQNAKGFTVNWPFISEGLEQIYDDPEVHKGFLQQFEAVTSKAKNDSTNIYKIYEELSNGTTPKLVWCTGQSLGGALSTLCAPWAAQAFPHSPVLIVNEGSPRAGDNEFRPYFTAVTGRVWRVVNGMDQVPTIPPAIDFDHMPKGLWMNDTEHLILDDRPPVDIMDTNWIDHNYYKYAYYQCRIQKPTVPNWVLAL